jgi:hypothetical protein
MSNYCPVYPDIDVITEILELLLNELCSIVGDDSVGDPKVKDNVLDKAYHLFV